MRDLVKKVEQWAHDRNIIKGATAKDQTLKLFEEMSEISQCRLNQDIHGMEDGFGDTFVVLIILCAQLDWDFYQIFEDIKDSLREPEKLGAEYLELRMFINASCIAADVCRGKGALEAIERTIMSVKSLALFLQFDIQECLRIAYDEIKDRKGRMVNGVYVKEDDL